LPEEKIKIRNIVFLVLALLTVVTLGVYLFFGDQILFYLENETDFFDKPAARSETEVLTIAYAFQHSEHDPIVFDPITRSHLIDIYEALVRTDENLNLKPALASSWGLIDPFTWEFILRKNVKFHNGELMTADDVIASVERAKNDKKSQLVSLLNTVESIEKIDDYKVRIKTIVPDPLLLQKIGVTLISPEGYTDFDHPMGTGPYRFVSHSSDTMELQKNENYWGMQPTFNHVVLEVIEDRRERIAALESGDVQFVLNFPPNYGCSFIEDFKDIKGCKTIDSEDIQLESIPGLEVSFIAFNFDHELFGQKKVRSAIKKALDLQVFRDIAFGFALPASQFVSSGVFGFNPDIEKNDYNLNEAKKEINEVIGEEFERIEVTFDYPEALVPIGQYVQAQMKELGITVILSPLSDDELEQKIKSGKSDFYYLGWRSELGDASDFLVSSVHSKNDESGYGLFNGINYSNKEVDDLIENAQKNLDTKSRIVQLQEAINIITEEDIIGIPLFESEVVYAFRDDIQFKPRIDGYVLASSIK